MRRLISCFLALSLLLTGCSWLDGSYSSVTPHQQHSDGEESLPESVENYLQLRSALENMILSGVQKSVISLKNFRQDQIDDSMDMAVRYVKNSFPMGAYAVEDITYEMGSVGSGAAVAVEITYLHEYREVQAVQRVADMDQARERIGHALTEYDAGLVMLVENYEAADIHQMVDDFAQENPSAVMETPEITVQMYPDSGRQRVLELKFSYESSRDSLRSMQEVVQRVFNSAALYVSRDARDYQKLSQLYAFLMERFDSYQIKTSITPAYSLLNHGVGDSYAFAVVYAEMCRRAEVECYVVVGTCRGEPWYWNVVLDDGHFYHVDLLACQQRGGYRELTDSQMKDYVWDYSAYPECTGRPAETEIPTPTAESQAPETTMPEDVLEAEPKNS